MKLDRKDIKKAAKALADIPYRPVKESCYIAIPIESSRNCDFGGVELTVKNNTQGVTRPPEPVLLMNYKEKTPVTLGFADIMYARRFNLFEYCDLLGCQPPRSADILRDLDVILVDKTNVLMSFEL